MAISLSIARHYYTFTYYYTAELEFCTNYIQRKYQIFYVVVGNSIWLWIIAPANDADTVVIMRLTTENKNKVSVHKLFQYFLRQATNNRMACARVGRHFFMTAHHTNTIIFNRLYVFYSSLYVRVLNMADTDWYVNKREPNAAAWIWITLILHIHSISIFHPADMVCWYFLVYDFGTFFRRTSSAIRNKMIFHELVLNVIQV